MNFVDASDYIKEPFNGIEGVRERKLIGFQRHAWISFWFMFPHIPQFEKKQRGKSNVRAGVFRSV
jgi:hypothetical protein